MTSQLLRADQDLRMGFLPGCLHIREKWAARGPITLCFPYSELRQQGTPGYERSHLRPAKLCLLSGFCSKFLALGELVPQLFYLK